jgi:hypothetical protein
VSPAGLRASRHFVSLIVLTMLFTGVSAAACRRSGERMDLIDRVGEAQKSPGPSVFFIEDTDLGGERHRAIAIAPVDASRVSWRLMIPKGAWLWVSIGMQVEAWKKEGDGVTFIAGVSDGGTFKPLFEQHLHPYAREGDRKWFPIRVPLTPYEGREVEIVFTTAASADPARPDQRNDLPLWGVPEIVVR